jgi:TPR repeat protein
MQLAAEQGDSTAQIGLSGKYHSGTGVPQDDAEAIRWLRLAADQGAPVAIAALAQLGL